MELEATNVNTKIADGSTKADFSGSIERDNYFSARNTQSVTEEFNLKDYNAIRDYMEKKGLKEFTVEFETSTGQEQISVTLGKFTRDLEITRYDTSGRPADYFKEFYAFDDQKGLWSIQGRYPNQDGKLQNLEIDTNVERANRLLKNIATYLQKGE